MLGEVGAVGERMGENPPDGAPHSGRSTVQRGAYLVGIELVGGVGATSVIAKNLYMYFSILDSYAANSMHIRSL